MPIAMRLALSGALLSVAAGCSTYIEDREHAVFRLQVGMSREEVLSIMGPPRQVETIGNVEFWLYRPSIEENQPENITSIGILNGRVSGWGRGYYEDATRGMVGSDGSVSKRK